MREWEFVYLFIYLYFLIILIIICLLFIVTDNSSSLAQHLGRGGYSNTLHV